VARPPDQTRTHPVGALLAATAACLLVAGCVHRARIQPKGFDEARSTLSQLEAALQPQRWALVIGVDTYRDPTFRGLRHAADDAREVARVLRDPEAGAFDRVITLTSPEQTTREAILFELSRLRFDLRRQDTFVFYFSGHGTVEFTQDGTPILYLVAADTRASDLWGTGIELGALRAFVNELKPQRKVMILDNCFAGRGKSRISAVTRERLAQNPDPWPSLRESMTQSEAILMASTLGGIAQEDDTLGQGVYTHYLLDALTTDRLEADTNRDGALTAYEAHDYARVKTVEHTGGTQIPEAFFRVLGRAEIFLSGTPNPDAAASAALVYAYGTGPQVAFSLEIDGRPKGSFPKTVAVEPGLHQVTLRNSNGDIVSTGALKFGPGQTYSVGVLLEELEGYRRFFGIETGPSFQVIGPARYVWGDDVMRLGFISGYRVRGGILRGLALSFTLGWNPAYSGLWVDLTDQDLRHLVDFGCRIVLRRPFRQFQLGAGWQASAIYTPPVLADQDSLPSMEQRQYLHTWLTLHQGPVLWQAYALDRHLLLTLEQRASWFAGDFQDSLGRTPNLQLAFSAGLEVGF